MKHEEALKVINKKTIPGYMVSFDHVEDGGTRGGHFPDKHAGEALIETEQEAWGLAQAFATKTKYKCVNICVMDSNFTPVPGYETRMIKNR